MLTKICQRRQFSTAAHIKMSEGDMNFIFHLQNKDDSLGSSVLEAVFNRPKQMNAISINIQVRMLSMFKH